MTHSLACAICCSVPLVFSFSSLLNLGSKTRSCTQQSAGFSPTPPFQRGVPCISGEPVSVALLNCENLSLVVCQTCCALSMPAVGHALHCLLLAMLFFRRLFGSACACHPRLLPVVTQRLCCSSSSSVSLCGPPDCNANSLFQLCHRLFSSPCACHPRLFSAYPNSILWVASSK